MVTTVCVFLVATFLGTCVHENSAIDMSDAPGYVRLLTYSYQKTFRNALDCDNCLYLFQGDVTFKNETRKYFCPPVGGETFFNDMATLMFNSPEVAIRQLFHQNGKTHHCCMKGPLTQLTMCLYRCLYFAHSLDTLCCLLLCGMLDSWGCYICWRLYSLPPDWSNLWKICGHSFRV